MSNSFDLYRISMHHDSRQYGVPSRQLGREHLAELRPSEEWGEAYFPLCGVGRRISDGWCVEAEQGGPLCRTCSRIAGERTVYELT